MNKDKKKKSVADRLTYAYIRRIKRWMYCPACQCGKMTINKKLTMWTCEECGYQLSADEFEDNYVFWFCDECKAYLNNQEGFDRGANKHICTECGFEHDMTLSNLKGVCSNCGKVIPDPEGTLCANCLLERRRKAKERLITAGRVIGVVAAVAGATYLVSQANSGQDYTALVGDSDDEEDSEKNIKYPTCRTCRAKMTDFDGWAWYTCPECGDMVRIVDGIVTWNNEIFGKSKKLHYSDFELADFCRGGDLTES